MAGVLRVAFFALLLATPMAAADWMQYGGDAGRRGVAQGEGPDWPDVSYQIGLEAAPETAMTWPIITDGYAYFLVNATSAGLASGNPNGLGPTNLYRIDLENATSELVQTFNTSLYHLAYANGTFFAAGAKRLIAFGEVAWERDLALVAEATVRPQFIGGAACGPPLATADSVFVGCFDDPAYRRMIVVHAFDLGGTPRWKQPFIADTTPPPACDVDTTDLSCQDDLAMGQTSPFVPVGYGPPGLSLNEGTLFVTARGAGDTSTQGQGPEPDAMYGSFAVYVVDVQSGDGARLDSDYSLRVPGAGFTGSAPSLPPPAIGDREGIFVLGHMLRRFDTMDPTFHAPERERAMWSDRLSWGAGLVLSGDDLFATSASELFRLTRDLEDHPSFTPFKLPEDEVWASGPVALSGDVLIVRSHRTWHSGEGTLSILYGIDAHTGTRLWRHLFDDIALFAVSDGLVVAVDRAGVVSVLGTTSSSLTPRMDDVGRYPAVGDEVVADLRGTVGTRFGAATLFRADWGDGATTGWGDEPVMRHRYSSNGDMNARFFVRNDANQTASVAMTFFVGRPDPAVNILNAPFSDAYQETSFFMLGLVLTFLVALIGVYRAGRKRRRLDRELRELEAQYRALHDDSARCDAMLTERKARARTLFLQKRLEEAHASFLERRIDEMRQGLRISTGEEKLKFLPFGMVQHLRRLLHDGRIDGWERDHFVEALDRAPELSEAQRGQVHRLIETWFASDAGGA